MIKKQEIKGQDIERERNRGVLGTDRGGVWVQDRRRDGGVKRDRGKDSRSVVSNVRGKTGQATESDLRYIKTVIEGIREIIG